MKQTFEQRLNQAIERNKKLLEILGKTRKGRNILNHAGCVPIFIDDKYEYMPTPSNLERVQSVATRLKQIQLLDGILNTPVEYEEDRKVGKGSPKTLAALESAGI